MVTIALSTVSVITSILIFRLQGFTSPLPRAVHAISVRLARYLCVRLEHVGGSASTLSVNPDDSSSSVAVNCSAKLPNNVGASGNSKTDLDGTQRSTKVDCCCQLIGYFDSLLCEVRKVIGISTLGPKVMSISQKLFKLQSAL